MSGERPTAVRRFEDVDADTGGHRRGQAAERRTRVPGQTGQPCDAVPQQPNDEPDDHRGDESRHDERRDTEDTQP
jgi:hypothetical protein